MWEEKKISPDFFFFHRWKKFWEMKKNPEEKLQKFQDTNRQNSYKDTQNHYGKIIFKFHGWKKIRRNKSLSVWK